jgi:hypothetical protein
MRGQLEPIAEGFESSSAECATAGTFAIFDRQTMTSLASAMPDAQSAVLFCLAWHAAIQVRMSRGPLAGQYVARVSATSLAQITGRAIRTVWYAIKKLRSAGMIKQEAQHPGRTSVYRVSLRGKQIGEP